MIAVELFNTNNVYNQDPVYTVRKIVSVRAYC